MSAIMNMELMPIGCKSRYTKLDYDFSQRICISLYESCFDRPDALRRLHIFAFRKVMK
jgi:hypothetical protein